MEHIVTSSIMRHAYENDILYDLQHGFRDRRSCETQLIEFVGDVVSIMQRGKQTDVLIMDFSKEFDKVGHLRLLLKIEHYGIQGRTLNWIKSFLSNRKQCVVLEVEVSDEVDVLSGVPPRICTRPLSVLLLYQQYARRKNIKSKSLCERYHHVPGRYE